MIDKMIFFLISICCPNIDFGAAFESATTGQLYLPDGKHSIATSGPESHQKLCQMN